MRGEAPVGRREASERMKEVEGIEGVRKEGRGERECVEERDGGGAVRYSVGKMTGDKRKQGKTNDSMMAGGGTHERQNA